MNLMTDPVHSTINIETYCYDFMTNPVHSTINVDTNLGHSAINIEISDLKERIYLRGFPYPHKIS